MLSMFTSGDMFDDSRQIFTRPSSTVDVATPSASFSTATADADDADESSLLDDGQCSADLQRMMDATLRLSYSTRTPTLETLLSSSSSSSSSSLSSASASVPTPPSPTPTLFQSPAARALYTLLDTPEPPTTRKRALPTIADDDDEEAEDVVEYVPISPPIVSPAARALSFMTHPDHDAEWKMVIVNEKNGAAADIVVARDDGSSWRIDVALLAEQALYFMDAFGGAFSSYGEVLRELGGVPADDDADCYTVPASALARLHVVARPYDVDELCRATKKPTRAAFKTFVSKVANTLGARHRRRRRGPMPLHVLTAPFETLTTPPFSLEVHAPSGWPLLIVRSADAFAERFDAYAHDERRRAARDHHLVESLPLPLTRTPVSVLNEMTLIPALVRSCIVFSAETGELLSLPFLRDNDIIQYSLSAS